MWLAAELLFTNLNKNQLKIKETLFVVQMIHYSDFKLKFPSHLLILKIEKVCLRADITLEELNEISKLIKSSFYLKNIAAVNLNSLPVSIVQHLENSSNNNQLFLSSEQQITNLIQTQFGQIKNRIEQ